MNGDFVALPGGKLPGGGAWNIWRGMVLRGAGFPVSDVDRLGDPALADAADRALARAFEAGRKWPGKHDLEEFDGRFAASAEETSATIAGIARQPRYLEALTWQNPQFVRNCVDRLEVAGQDRRSKLRKQQAVISNYIQRYTTKNESIGFFGPVAWAEWATGDRTSSLRAGPALVSRRTVYFETWAIDEVAAALARRPELLHGVQPRRSPAIMLDGNSVIRPNGGAEALSEEWARIMRLCDGCRPVRDIASAVGRPEPWLLEQLELMAKSGLVWMDLSGPVEPRAERRLAERLARVPDAGARQAAMAGLAQLVTAKDEVAASAGDPRRLAAALAALAANFENITERPSVRLPGQPYAARTIVYEDCVRDVRLTLGEDVLESLGESLAPVLHSARWLTARVGQVYLSRFGELYERLRRRSGAEWVPLGRLLAVATPDLNTSTGTPALVADAVRELQQRWAAIFSVPAGARRHQVEPAHIAAQVQAQFCSGPPQWAGGLRHSPDVLIDAASVDAINRGEYRLVLGELHTAYNSVEATALVEQSDDKARLLAMAEHATGSGRIVLTAGRDWSYVTRTRPSPDVLSPRHLRWAAGTDDISDVTTEVIPLGALEVGPGLVVRCRTDQRTFALAEVLGDYLSEVVVSSFRMMPPQRHNARVSIGRLVVSRETWRFAPRFCDWVHQEDERRRFLQMRQWVARHELPRRVFCSLPGERKPVYADFTSIPLTNSLATMLRRLTGDDAGHVTFSEMLPGPDGCWLKNQQGASFVSELRLVVSER
jgi:lantibiotic biosynthesis dehydratase-like protein